MAFGGPASQGHVVPSVALSVFEHRRGESMVFCASRSAAVAIPTATVEKGGTDVSHRAGH